MGVHYRLVPTRPVPYLILWLSGALLLFITAPASARPAWATDAPCNPNCTAPSVPPQPSAPSQDLDGNYSVTVYEGTGILSYGWIKWNTGQETNGDSSNIATLTVSGQISGTYSYRAKACLGNNGGEVCSNYSSAATVQVIIAPGISGVDNVANYTENAAPIIIDSTITITDADSANLNQATVGITGNFSSSQDQLVYSTINGITGSYNSSTGLLTLSGTATKAQYEQALESVKYQNSSNSPSTAARTLSFVVRDTDNQSSAADTTTLTVTAVNDAPVISGVDNIAAFAAPGHAVPVTIDDSITISDPDNSNLNQATVSITANFSSSQDQLIYSTDNGITGSYNSSTGVLTLSGAATKAQYEQALGSVKYWNSSSSPSTATRTVSFVVRDANNASSAADSTSILVTGNITPSAILPAEFDHNLNDISFLPDMGAGDFVAITQGRANVTNGAAYYTLPVELPPAVNDLKPGLSCPGFNGHFKRETILPEVFDDKTTEVFERV